MGWAGAHALVVNMWSYRPRGAGRLQPPAPGRPACLGAFRSRAASSLAPPPFPEREGEGWGRVLGVLSLESLNWYELYNSVSPTRPGAPGAALPGGFQRSLESLKHLYSLLYMDTLRRGATSAGSFQRCLDKAFVASAASGSLNRKMLYFSGDGRPLLGSWKRFCSFWEPVKCFVGAGILREAFYGNP